MATRFPQGTGSLSYRIKPAWSGKIEAVWWAVAANTAQRLFYGATSTTVITRTDSGCSFNSTDGRITGTNTPGTTTTFSDSTGTSTGIGSLNEDSNFVFGVGYYGDLFNGAGASARMMLGSRVPPDTLTVGAQLKATSYDIIWATANQGANAISTSGGYANDVKDFIQIAMKHNQADGTKDLRIWYNGSENTSSGLASVTPDKSTAIGSSTYPVYFGDTFTGTGNTVLEWEFAFIGTASLTSADLDSITSTGTNPADVLLEAVTAPPNAPTGVTVGTATPVGFTVSWTDNSSDETGFLLETSPSPYSSWSTETTTAANATSYVVTGKTDGVTYKARVTAKGASADSAAVESGTITTLALTRLRPNADTTVGSATSTGANLYGVLDETTADDADYITIPGTLTSISLVQGHPSETNIKTWTPSPGASFATSTLTMTSGEASAITNYGDLYLKIVTSSTTTKVKFETSTDPGDDNYHALVIRLRTA